MQCSAVTRHVADKSTSIVKINDVTCTTSQPPGTILLYGVYAGDNGKSVFGY